MREIAPWMSSLPKRPAVATSATQPEQLIQPVIQERIGIHFLHEVTATQWYWPPAVGYAERNSAREVAMHKLQIPAVMRPVDTHVSSRS